MTEFITLPYWLFLLLVGASFILVLQHLFIPCLRWYYHKRLRSLLGIINTKLSIEIKPFQLTRRTVLIDRLLFDKEVIATTKEYAVTKNISIEMAQFSAKKYVQEIVPSFNAYAYFRIGYWIAKKIVHLLYRVRVNFKDTNHLATVDPKATVVFIMNHRSNMDYILVSFLVAERTVLSYAVGEWARIWPLQTLIKAMGAFFVRRNSNDPLYRKVLERYVYMSTQEGVCQAVFLEGGLSRDGKLREPKFGYLNYIVRYFHSQQSRDVVFIPVGINYDRTLEDRSLLRSLESNVNKRPFIYVLKTAFVFVSKNIYLMLRNRFKRLGFACVNFGHPISLREMAQAFPGELCDMDKAERMSQVEKLAKQLMIKISQLVPALPIPLVCAVLVKCPQDHIDALDLYAQTHALINSLEQQGYWIAIPPNIRIITIQNAVEMLKIRHFIAEEDGHYYISESQKNLLQYYANSLPH